MPHLSRPTWKNQYFFITFLGGIALSALGISALVFYFGQHFLVQFRVPCDPLIADCLLETCPDETACRVSADAFFSYAQAPASLVSSCDGAESCLDRCLASGGKCQVLACDPSGAEEGTECLSPQEAALRLSDMSSDIEQSAPPESIESQPLPTE